MTKDKILTALVPICIAAVLLGFLFTLDRCAKRNTEFQMECIKNGGLYISAGLGSGEGHCIHQGKVKTNE